VRWLSRDQLREPGRRLRSPLVRRCVEDYVAGVRYPCALINHLEGASLTSLAASG
jgi:hypothetical protein